MYAPFTRNNANANEPQNPLAYLATSNNTASNPRNPAHSQPSPSANSDISFSTLASVSALSLTSNPNNDYRASRQYFRPEESSGHVSRPASVWLDNNGDFQQPTNPMRHVGAGRFWAPPNDTVTSRTTDWRRLSGRVGGAELDRPPPSYGFSLPPPRYDEEMVTNDGASAINPWDSSFSRPSMDDAASFVSSVGSSSLSRQSSSVASLRSLRARDSAPSDLFVSRPMSLADRIAANERRKKTQEMLKYMCEEEERKAELAAIEEDEQVLPKPEEQRPVVFRRASAASSRGPREPQPIPSPRIERLSPTGNFPAIDEFADTEELTKWNDGSHDPLQKLLRPDNDKHRNDLKDMGIVVEDEEIQEDDSPKLPEEPLRASEPPTNPKSLSSTYELHNQWNDSIELQENVRKPPPSPKPGAAKLHSQWNEPQELQHTKSTKAPKPPPKPVEAELFNQRDNPLELHHEEKPPDVAELPNQWAEPVELQHVEAKKKPLKKAPNPPLRPKPDAVSTPAIIATPELDSTSPEPPSVFELEGSIFADTDSIINALPTRNRTPTLIRGEPANPPSSARGANSWLSDHPQSNYFDPHALYAELPAVVRPAPPPYKPYNAPPPPPPPPARHTSPLPPPLKETPHTQPPIPHRASAPPPPNHTFELSSSSSVLYRPRHKAVHEIHRTTRHHSDLTLYNTLPGEPYPLMPEDGRVELPARPYESDRRDLYSWDNCPVEMDGGGGGRGATGEVRPDVEWGGGRWTG